MVISFLFFLLIGVIIGCALSGWHFSKVISEEKKIAVAWSEKVEKLAEERSILQTLLNVEKEKSEALTVLQEKELTKVQERFTVEFENLTNKIFTEKSREFADTSKGKIEELLSPLKQKMDIFQLGMQEIVKTGTAERLTLKNKIEGIVDSSKALAMEANHLARALKGDVKKQGTWGELILQKVLEASGLREDQEYVLQGSGLELSTLEGRRMQPDVIINLPDTKKVIIDSKMSYTHYDDYFNATSVVAREESLKKLVLSLKEHIRGLSEKKYQFLEKLENPDFVLLFVPIEAIFSLVIEAEPSLFEEAWKKSIIIVSPANLLAVLRTIESIWKVERQNRNTQKIAEEGAALYDKFVDFLKDLEGIGKSLKTTSDHFDKAMQKISLGRGNLVKKTEDLKRLGLKTKKHIPEEYLEEVLELQD